MRRLNWTCGFVVMSTTVCAASARAAAPTELSRAERAAGWKVLFDGQSTSKWRGYRTSNFPANRWSIDNGCLKSAGGGEEHAVDLITNDQYGDFELVLEWKTAPGGNSGIVYRVAEKEDRTWQTGPEYQILDDSGAKIEPTDMQSAGALYALYAPAAAKQLKPAGEFNLTRIRLQDNHLEHWLNGAKIVECDINSDDFKSRVGQSKFNQYEGFAAQRKGHIALQDHGDVVWFRNIKVRDLGGPMPGEISLFDGTSMKGWTHHLEPDGKMEDTWQIENGILICKGQPNGYIRTEADYTNYVLKLQWRFNPVTKQAGNSGVLLRMIGPDKVWPKSIEAQLHSENAGDFWNIDEFQMKTDPERTKGRNTKKLRMAERPIGEWNEYEIIVDGGDITLNVNGDTLNHAWDVAEVPGKICLQSEGAEIQFRNIRLAPIN